VKLSGLADVRRIVAAVIIGLAAVGVSFSSVDAKPKIIRDQCNQTSGDGMGHNCPGPDDMLIRPKYEDGTCGDWMCCPPNGDGTYDCANATNPTRALKNRFKNLRAPQANTLSPAETPPPSTTSPTAPVGQKPKTKSQ
jgi:hypothetical protein